MRKLLVFTLALAIPLQGIMGQSLRGSKSALLKQNAVANREKLSRFKTEKEIRKSVKSGRLVPIPNGKFGIRPNSKLEASRRYCRPQSIRFAKVYGARVSKRFKKQWIVNSCVRDEETQTELRKTNKNAAPPFGPTASSHLTGSTMDIRRKGFTQVEQKIIRGWLLKDERCGWIEATEERRQQVWHIMVYKNYGASCKARARKKKA